MTRRARSNLILLALVALLAAAVYAELRREAALAPQPLSAIDLGTVRSLAVSCNTCRTRRFEKIDGRWRMREPYALAADDRAVGRLLRIAHATVRSLHPAGDFDAKKIGLDPAQNVLEIGSLRLAIGTTDAIDADRYVQVGDRIALVPDNFSPFLAETPEAELDRHLVPCGEALHGIELDGAGRADLLAAWQNALATQVVKPDAELQFKGKPLRFSLRFADDKSLDYAIYRNGNDYVAVRADPPLVYAIDAATAQALLAQPPRL